MTEAAPPSSALHRIAVRVQVGSDRLAATDDPLFLGLEGPGGREFRLARRRGKSLRRGSEDLFVLAGPDEADTNVGAPELNDPNTPPIDLERIMAVYLRKGQEPIPNVRGIAELDDRVQIERVEVELHAHGRKALRFACTGPVWLGLVCGERVYLAPADEG